MSEAPSLAWGAPMLRVRRGAQRVAAARQAGGPPPAPLVAVLCAPPRARVAAAATALALARAAGRPCGLAAAVGVDAEAALVAAPGAARAAAALRRRGLPARASGRLVQLADRRGALAVEADEAPARAAALSAELGRSAAALGVPAAIGLPFARTDALDRVLAWHDAIVVVREPDACAAVIDRALSSLAELGRDAAAMAPPARLRGALAVAGLAAPPEATAAVRLALGGASGTPDA